MGTNFIAKPASAALFILLAALLGTLLLAPTPGSPVGPEPAAAAKSKKKKSGKRLRARPPRVVWLGFREVGRNQSRLDFTVTGNARVPKGQVIGRARVVFQGRLGKNPFRSVAQPRRVKIKAGVRTFRSTRITANGRRFFSRYCEARNRSVRAVVIYRHRGARKAKVVRAFRHPKGPGCLGRNPEVVDPVRPTSPSCDQTDPALCLLPWPNDHFAVDDDAAPTGQRLNLADDQLPANADGKRIGAVDYNLADGFSPGQPILTHVPGLDNPAAFAQTDAVPVNAISRYAEPDAPVVLLDTETRQRVPIWVELDSLAGSPARTMLQIHPAVPLDPGRRYVAALRNLKRADGSLIEAGPEFREAREGRGPTGTGLWQYTRLRTMMEELESAGISRDNLYLSWEFTVASEQSTTGRMLSIRDRAFADLGDGNLANRVVEGSAPGFTIDSIERFTIGQDPRIARTVRGRVTVACYLAPDCGVGGRFELNPAGLPRRNGTWQAPFVCIVPRSSEVVPARAAVYGHGLFHVKEEVESINHRRLSNDHNVVQCATAQIGMSADDILNTLTAILPDLTNFPQLADRLQQGILNELVLGRLMIHPQGLISDPAFRAGEDPGAEPVILTGPSARLGYSGYSLGGILGGLFTAVSPDSDRGVLGVPGMRFSMMLPRSTQYDPFAAILEANYSDPLERSLILSLLQLLWDRGEPNGYAKRITGDPLPNTPPHEALILVAFGDHQVSNYASDLLARATGAAVRQPLLDPGRWPGMEQTWGIQPIASYPHAGSGMIYADTGPTRPGPAGTDPPPLVNQPNRSGVDPHGAPWAVAALRQSVSDFLQPDGEVTNPCGTAPCYAGGWTGP